MRVKARWLSLLVVTMVTASSAMALSGGAGASAPRAQDISGNKIKVGGLFDALSFAGADDGFNARISRANKSKELGKYTVDYIGSTDVASSTDKALATTQSLVERDQVF